MERNASVRSRSFSLFFGLQADSLTRPLIDGHHCPRGPTCSRQHCAFNDDVSLILSQPLPSLADPPLFSSQQHRVVPTPRPTLRRRPSFVVSAQQAQLSQISQISQLQQLSSRRF